MTYGDQPETWGKPKRDNNYNWATVTSLSPVAIKIDGDDDPLPFTPDLLVNPTTLSVNHRVWVQFYGRSVIVIGRAW